MPTIDIVRLDEDPHETIQGIRADTSSRGVDLDGAVVIATYADGSIETLTWQAFDPYTNGGVTGTDISMLYGWQWHELATTKLLASLQIDLQPASSVFDTNTTLDDDPAVGSTPGSSNGFTFEFDPDAAVAPGDVTVTYSGIVNLVERPADGDLYTTMLVDFSSLQGGGFLGEVDWNSDIDTMRDAGDLVPVGEQGQTIAGTPDPDDLIGGIGSDMIQALASDDTITGGFGDDTIDGGEGADTAVYSGNQASYTLTLSPTRTTVTDRRPDGNGIDELIDMEFLDFDTDLLDGPFNLDVFGGPAGLSAPELESFVELYIAYFNRAPDAVGLNFWGTQFASGLTLEAMAALFGPQDETSAAYPEGTSNNEFATTVYNNVLGRTPDQGGIDFWVGHLDTGSVGREQFILEVLQGAKSDPKPELGQDFVDQQIADNAFLETKTDIGAYFAVIKGMSDVEDAMAAMAFFDGTQSGIDNAVAAIDGFYSDALDPANGEFLMPLVGVLDDPFAIA